LIGPPYYDQFQIPVLTLEETVAEKLRTLLQRQRPTDLSDLALILGESGDRLDRSRIRELANTKFELVKQGDRRSRIETNVEALETTYRETVPGLAPDAPPFADARALALSALPSLLP
jgi:predicted nucleotidyltransferase component of viral defense system